MASPQVRIVNEGGHGLDTRVTDIETGEDLTRKLMVSRIEIDATEYLKATIHVDMPAINVVARAETKRTAHIILDPDDPESVERALTVIRQLAAGEGA